MKIVVDTNIIFSAILNPNGKIGDLVLDTNDHFTFFAPDFLLTELDRHHQKLISISKFAEEDISFLKKMVISKLVLVDLETIDQDTWRKSIELVVQIDEFDAPFVALALEMDCFLWTGDKKLKNGMEKLGITWVVDTIQLLDMKS